MSLFNNKKKNHLQPFQSTAGRRSSQILLSMASVIQCLPMVSTILIILSSFLWSSSNPSAILQCPFHDEFGPFVLFYLAIWPAHFYLECFIWVIMSSIVVLVLIWISLFVYEWHSHHASLFFSKLSSIFVSFIHSKTKFQINRPKQECIGWRLFSSNLEECLLWKFFQSSKFSIHLNCILLLISSSCSSLILMICPKYT